MNALLIPCSLLLVTTGATLLLTVMQRRQPAATAPFFTSSWRRETHLVALAAPAISLIVGLLVVVGWRSTCATPICGGVNDQWTVVFSYGLLVAPTLIALSALIVGALRLATLLWVMRRQTLPAPATYQALIRRLARRMGAPIPRLRIRHVAHPLAVTYGVTRPTVLLSTWMLRSLDEQELEAVLAHELGHIVRHDFLLMWLATTLRDAFFYLPTSQEAYRRLRNENEIACDDLALATTRHPLDLASALAKVWCVTTGAAPACAGAQPFAAPGEATAEASAVIEGRISRLMDLPQPLTERSIPHTHALSVSLAHIACWLLVGTVTLVAALALMGCVPGVAPSHAFSTAAALAIPCFSFLHA